MTETGTDRVATPLDELSAAGVAVWLDDLSRQRLRTGGLAELMRTHRVTGVTTNPTIFAAAVSGGDAYNGQLAELARAGADAEGAVLALTSDDVRAAADVLRPVHDATGGADGWVSLEVDPRLAGDSEATVAQARDLWTLVGRPNTFIKIPATRAGLVAIEETLAHGISVNVTLIFSLERYREVLEAHLAGLERAQAAGHDLATIGSVASFFVSRVDAAVDRELDGLATPGAAALRGRAAIANARLAHALHREVVAGQRWGRLAARGARPQRPLWASTGVKDPAYADTRYVDELVVAGVVNTMPEGTLLAVADHGRVRGDTVTGTHEEATRVIEQLAGLGIDLDKVTHALEEQGVAAFVASWEQLLATVSEGLARARSADPA